MTVSSWGNKKKRELRKMNRAPETCDIPLSILNRYIIGSAEGKVVGRAVYMSVGGRKKYLKNAANFPLATVLASILEKSPSLEH